MVTLARRAQRIPFAPVVAILFGIAAAVLVAAVPQWMFEAGVVASGLPTVLAAAAPPLGLIARLLAVGLAFCAVAFLVWALLAPLTRYLEAKARARTPWRDAGYDADAIMTRDNMMPPRRPIFAPDELGAPLMSDEAIAAVAPFLEQAPFLEAEPELEAPVIIEERQPTFAAPVQADNSITALIRRLEDGLARRASNDTDPDGPGSSAMALSRSWIVPDNVEASPVIDEDSNAKRMARG